MIITFFVFQIAMYAVVRTLPRFFHTMDPENPRLYQLARAPSTCSAQQLREAFHTSWHELPT